VPGAVRRQPLTGCGLRIDNLLPVSRAVGHRILSKQGIHSHSTVITTL
jgi:hypothetical protein